MYYTNDFSYNEFVGHSPSTEGIMVMRQDFMAKLQRLREFIGIPIYVSHGLRSWYEQFYGICNGDPKKYYESEHQFGNAADIYLWDTSVERMLNLAALAKMVGFKRIGLYPYSISKFIHVDMGIPKPSESWIKNKKGRYDYYNTITEAIEIIKKGDKNVQ